MSYRDPRDENKQADERVKDEIGARPLKLRFGKIEEPERPFHPSMASVTILTASPADRIEKGIPSN